MVLSMQHNGYIHLAGSEVSRAAIAQRFGSPRAPLTMDDDIIASEWLIGVAEPGDNILLSKPGFPLYQTLCESHQVECRFYNLMWETHLNQMQSLVDDRTKGILINNPSNPCGSVYSKPHLENILALAEQNKIPIIADEIHGDMVFGSNVFFPIATLTKTVPVVAVDGLAKQFLIRGWRSVIPDILTPGPGSAEELLLVDFKKRYYATLAENAHLTIETISKIPDLEVFVPQGAMYAMVKVQTDVLTSINDDFYFTQKLLEEESVFVLPGQVNNYHVNRAIFVKRPDSGALFCVQYSSVLAWPIISTLSSPHLMTFCATRTITLPSFAVAAMSEWSVKYRRREPA
ncbi:hypothetical protein PsorP6_016855 [Peronosclerospora sorghi]|uniref:Uncharacterized protein n=1 Tax=Peronosclerospora sorghi TaxID=230839 RepID=A0ACC0WEA6_9STRA|nr:hypothetical protein PsorP6_016855 [Peronosclerospora sorghi]